MISIRLFILSCFFWQVLPAQSPDLDWFNNNIIKSELNAASQKLSAYAAAPTGNYDLKYHRCIWNINPDTLMISGSVSSKILLTDTAEFIYFDAGASLTIDSIFVDGLEVSFIRDSNDVKILFDAPKTAGLFLTTNIYYHGSPQSSGFGSFVKGQNASGNIIWTLSEPYGASDWWPCKQTLNDKIDSIDIFITTPAPFKAAAPGLLISTTALDDDLVYHWKSNYPIVTYLIGIAVSTFEMFEFYTPHNSDSVLFYNLVYPESLDAAVDGVNAIIPSFELFTDIYGDYPFAEEKYGHMQFGWGGGMEHQTMSSVTHFGYELLVHEMAHQWFGDKITCASWSDIWLNEGFATYSTWLSFDFSEDPYNYYEAWLTQTRDKIVAKPDGSVYVSDTSLVSRIFDSRLSYYKGAWLLHMLRDQLGDDDFFAAIKNYITNPEFAYSFVTTNDLIEHLESAADTSLTEFFQDWFYGEGFPAYNLIWTQDDGYNVTLSLNQTPSHNSVDFFEMDVPVRLKNATDSIDIKLKHTNNGQLYAIPLTFKADEIIIDPDLKLLHANDVVVRADLMPDVVQLVVYPSPASDEITIQLFSLLADEYYVTIYSGAAERMLETQFSGDASNALFKVDATTWSPGLYVIVVKNSTTEIVQKIMVN